MGENLEMCLSWALNWIQDLLWARLMSSNRLGFRIWDLGGLDIGKYVYLGVRDTIELSGVVLKDVSNYYVEYGTSNEWTTRHLPPWELSQRQVLSIDGSEWVFNGHFGFRLAQLSNSSITLHICYLEVFRYACHQALFYVFRFAYHQTL